MALRPIRLLVAAAYHLALVTGILLMPIALLARQAGITLPFDRVVRRLRDAYAADP